VHKQHQQCRRSSLSLQLTPGRGKHQKSSRLEGSREMPAAQYWPLGVLAKNGLWDVSRGRKQASAGGEPGRHWIKLVSGVGEGGREDAEKQRGQLAQNGSQTRRRKECTDNQVRPRPTYTAAHRLKSKKASRSKQGSLIKYRSFLQTEKRKGSIRHLGGCVLEKLFTGENLQLRAVRIDSWKGKRGRITYWGILH